MLEKEIIERISAEAMMKGLFGKEAGDHAVTDVKNAETLVVSAQEIEEEFKQ